MQREHYQCGSVWRLESPIKCICPVNMPEEGVKLQQQQPAMVYTKIHQQKNDSRIHVRYQTAIYFQTNLG